MVRVASAPIWPRTQLTSKQTGNLFPSRLNESHQDRQQNTNFRRNGKLQACEPCRKGKLRCDHMMPACGRCAKRNKPDHCVYHPAPLTKANGHATASEATSPRGDSFSATSQSPSGRGSAYDPLRTEAKRMKLANVHEPQPSFASLAAQPEPQSQNLLGVLHKPVDESFSVNDSAGFINQSAVLAENELSIGIQPPHENSTAVSSILQSQIERGAVVLTLFKDLTAIRKYIDKWFSFAGGIVVIEPMVNIYLEGLTSTWLRILESQKPADLRLMSERIWENTLKPVSRILNKQTTPREFCTNVTGAYLRWEVVGLLVTLVSLLAQSLKEGDPIFCTRDDAPIDRAALALRMHNASEICLQFCDDFGVLNDLYLWLLYENSIAYCSMRSKGGYESAKKMANLANALLSYNLHQEINVDDRTPFFMAELRKRLFICAYNNDKYMASSSGQPPKLTRQYCLLQTPLDLTDTQTMSEGTELEATIRNLNGEGWNRQGHIQRSTFARLATTNSLVIEEILEISLGNLPEEEVIQRAADIATRTNAAWAQLPEFLQFDSVDPWTSRRSPLEILFLALIKLDHLDHHFMLQRTLSKKTNAGVSSNTNLLTICSTIFDFVVKLADHKDHFRDFQVDFVQILVKHGIPAAAVLAVELLHQEQHPNSSSATAYSLHRSDTIQSLSVFVACLGSIRPQASGYHSCVRGRTFFKKVLDIILGAGAVARSPIVLDSDMVNDPMLGAPLVQPSDGDFVRWLEGMDWEQDSWINFS